MWIDPELSADRHHNMLRPDSHHLNASVPCAEPKHYFVATLSSNTITCHRPDCRWRWHGHREEARALKYWCQDNNLHLNVSKTKERGLQEGHASITIDRSHVRRVSGFRLLWEFDPYSPYRHRHKDSEPLVLFLQAKVAHGGRQDTLQLLQVQHWESPH